MREHQLVTLGGDSDELLLDSGDYALGEDEAGLAGTAELQPERHHPWARVLVCWTLLLLLLGWTGFVIFAHWNELPSASPAMVAALVAQWALPAVGVALAWLILVRGNSAEAIRFGRIAKSLAQESAGLEARARSLNAELSIAREFLAGQARELDALGRHSVDRLSDAARRLEGTLGESESHARSLETVSQAAVSNFDQLRRDLPVIITSAKELTNQVGNAGRNARGEMNLLIGSLRQTAQAGAELQERVEALETAADATAQRMRETGERMETALRSHLAAVAGSGETLAGTLVQQFESAAAATQQRALDDVSALNEAFTDLAGRIAQQTATVLSELQAGNAGIEQSAAATLEQVKSGAANAAETLTSAAADLHAQITLATDLLTSAKHELGATTSEITDRLRVSADHARERLAELRSELDSAGKEAAASLERQLIALKAAIAEVGATRRNEADGLEELAKGLERQLSSSHARVAELSRQGSQSNAQLAFALEALTGNVNSLSTLLTSAAGQTDHLLSRAEALAATAGSNRELLESALPAALGQVEDRARETQGILVQMSSDLEETGTLAAAVVDHVAGLPRPIDDSAERLAQLDTSMKQFVHRQLQGLHSLADLLRRIDAETVDLENERVEPIRTKLEAIRHRAESIRSELAAALEAGVAETQARIGEGAVNGLRDSLERALRDVEANAAERLSDLGRHSGVLVAGLDEEIGRLERLARSLETRIADAQVQLGGIDDADFIRRVTLVTEALNSISIDVAKVLSNEVTDTAWEAYLKGDRGVFTRRAVRLLDSGEARLVAESYEEDPEFREHVNRYVHDFEALMRQLLSVRDGGALGVTLLSSDVGKLYVALAQAIDRLRN